MSTARRFLLLTLLAAVAGCTSLSAPPKDRFYRLQQASASPPPSAATAGEIIYVAPFGASGLHSERALVFAHADGTSLEQHGYHFWVDSPRLMLQQALADRLAADLPARVVTEPTPDAGTIVRGRVRRFEHSTSAGGGTAEVELILAVYDGPRAAVPAFEKSYARSIATRGGDAAAGVAALDSGTAEILGAFSQDLAKHIE